MGARFLVVDDDDVVGRQLARLLRPFGEAVVAGSVAAALSLLGAHVAWDAFFIDLGLPDGSGLDVVRAARTAFPSVPAMVLTGNTEAELINAVYDLGASYVVKPVNSARIERVCREIASAKKGDRAATASPDPSAVPASLDGCIIRLRELLPLRIDPLVRYAIGAIIAEVKAKPELYGTSAVTAVAAALGEDTPSLYRHAAVAECWTEAGVRALLARTGGNGRSLTWSHAVLLGNVRSPIARRRLENRALEEGLSVRQLAELVEAEG